MSALKNLQCDANKINEDTFQNAFTFFVLVIFAVMIDQTNDNTIVKADHKKNAMETIANERFRVRYAEYCLRHKW